MPRSNRTKPRKRLDAPVNALLAELLALKRGQPDKIPKDHMTCDQWAEKWGFSRHKALRLLQAGVKAGKVKTAKHRIDTGKKVFPVVHYFGA